MAQYVGAFIPNFITSLLKKENNVDIKNASQQRPKLEDFLSLGTKNVEEKHFTGVITSINVGEGVVSNDVYFSCSLREDVRFNVGDKVAGMASRDNINSVWRAINIMALNEDWENDAQAPQPSVSHQDIPFHIIGKVLTVYDDLITLNTNISFTVNEITCSFRICVGDWICCERKDAKEGGANSQLQGNVTVAKVVPLRRKVIHGVVSHVQSSHYVINGEIFCAKYVFKRTLTRDNKVIVDVIESDVGIFSWRAIRGRMDPLTSISQSQDSFCLSDLKFDMPCANFLPHGEFLSLTVEGLAEKRPSLIIGDSVIASHPSMNEGSNELKYEGYIHDVLHNKVLLKFNPNFHLNYQGEDYFVQLCFNRTPLRRCHLAVSLVVTQLGENILFPSKLNYQLPQIAYIDSESIKLHCNSNTPPEMVPKGYIQRNVEIDESKTMDNLKFDVDQSGYCLPILGTSSGNSGPTLSNHNRPYLKWFNTSLNFEQKAAVKRIIEGSTRPLPYIIYGPPGTGKTITLVESILQVFKMVLHSRILVVAPTNSAADLVAERLIQSGCLNHGDVVRINSFNRCPISVPESIQEFCKNGQNLDIVVRHRIIVATAMMAGLLYTAKLKNGHFSHVFIDEAGQLTEPETCIALGLVNSSSGQIVLAGDPKQLGPVVMSPIAKRFGLGQSLLHRLCSSVLYQPQEASLQSIYSENESMDEALDERPDVQECYYEPRLVTLLVKNYRSHPDLLNVPSQLFYHSRLASNANQEICNRLLPWPELPNSCCPLLFHSIKGINQQEEDSPSWFNPAEVFQVCRYANSLIRHGLAPNQLGIITPYKKQVEKIRKLLSAFAVPSGIKVGPVEEFQGQEKTAIILSTVRSSESLVMADVRHSLGFLQSAERFNVAITRAMSLLIVVGNPDLLAKDPYWNVFISYCIHKKVIRQ